MKRFLTFVLLCLMPAFAQAETITVAAAISLKEALTAVAEDFSKKSGHEVQFNFGSSGQLAQQIDGGAPVDVFISAAVKQVDTLQEKQLLVVASRRDVALNALVLAVPTDATFAPASIDDLRSDKIRRIAIGQPKTVPAGQYAAEALKSAGLSDAITQKLIEAANVRQVLLLVERAEVDAGFVYASDLKAHPGKVKLAIAVDPKLHQPIVYPGAVVTASTKKDVATAFLDHLSSADGQKTLQSFGFVPPASVASTQKAQ